MAVEAEKPSVRARLKELCPSLRAVMPLEKLSVGGPQLVGSWSLPEMPAVAEMFWRFAKYGTMSVLSRLK